MPSHYLLTACLLSVCDHVVLSYVIRHTFCTLYLSYVVHRTCHTSYVIRLHRRTVALTWHSPSHGAVPGSDCWEFVGGGIVICKAVKLRRLGYIGLCRVRLVRWLAKRGWRPQAGQSAPPRMSASISPSIAIAASTATIIIVVSIIANVITMSIITVSFRLPFLLSCCMYVVLRYARTHSLCALPQSSVGVALQWRVWRSCSA